MKVFHAASSHFPEGEPPAWAVQFDDWLAATLSLPDVESRDQRILDFARVPVDHIRKYTLTQRAECCPGSSSTRTFHATYRCPWVRGIRKANSLGMVSPLAVDVVIHF